MSLRSPLNAAKWILAFLAVMALFATAPLWGVPWLLWTFFQPMVRDMKKVIDGEMRFW